MSSLLSFSGSVVAIRGTFNVIAPVPVVVTVAVVVAVFVAWL